MPHPNNVITASLALFFYRANNGLFSSTLIFFLLLNKTMETTKGETYTIAEEQAFIMDVCKTTVCSNTAYAFSSIVRKLSSLAKLTINSTKIGQMHLPRIQFLHSTQREYIKNFIVFLLVLIQKLCFHPRISPSSLGKHLK